MNGGDNKEAGNLAYAAVQGESGRRDADLERLDLVPGHVQLLQGRTRPGTSCSGPSSADHGLFGARKMDFVNPVRGAVWKDQEFRDRIAKSYPGYIEQYEASAPDAKIYFTPQPLFST